MDAIAAFVPYCGAPPAPAELLGRWNFDPLVIAVLFVTALAYAHASTAFPDRRGWFAAGVALLAVLFLSPFCALTSALFSARIVHHALLAGVVAPLLVAGLPRDRLRLPGSLAVWTLGHALVFWLWHAPAIYGWALSSDVAYWLMQLSIGGSAFGFWQGVRRAEPVSGIAALLATMVQMGLLGALIAFAGRPLYAPHLFGPQLWGLAPLEDQQLAGLIMWAPGAALYLAAALLLGARWLVRPFPLAAR